MKPKLQIIHLKNKKGTKVSLSNLGASLLSFKIKNLNNEWIDVVIGVKTKEGLLGKDYQTNNKRLGVTVGRCAGRISKGAFEIEGNRYEIHTKDGVHLHGGAIGFDKKYWEVKNIDLGENPSVEMTYFSPHLEEGYPGNMSVSANYQLTENNELIITYKANCDQKSIVNLTNHAYFNLNGKGNIKSHILQMECPQYLELDQQKLPTGKILKVEKNVNDFTSKVILEKGNFEALDTVFVTDLSQKKKVSLFSSKSGIMMEVFSNQPCMVVYTPPILPDYDFGVEIDNSFYPAICFEAEQFSDAINQAHFPDVFIDKGEEYFHQTTFKLRNHQEFWI
jgi:aldose 1-epimerase